MPMKAQFVFALALIVACALAQSRNVLKFSPKEDIGLYKRLKDEGYDVVRKLGQSHDVYVLANDEELDAMLKKYWQLPTELIQSSSLNFSLPEADAVGLPMAIPTGYPDLNEINTLLEKYHRDYPSITKLVDIAVEYGAGPTAEGRAIMGLLISDNPNVIEPEPTYIVLSTEHSREVCTPVIALDTIDRLLTGYNKDASIKSLIDSTQIWIVTVMNPDGYDYVFTSNNMWRKNRRPFSSTYGVDLNRNGKMGWYAPCSGSSNPSSITYKGPAPESEQETKAVIGLANEFGIAKYMEFHQSGAEQLFDYNCSPMPSNWRTYLSENANTLARAATPPYRLRSPSADGEIYQQFLQDYTSYSSLNEMATQGFQPSYSSCQTVVNGLRGLVDVYFNTPESVTGFVTNTAGQAVEANIDIDKINFQSDEVRKSHPRFGRFDLFLPADTYRLTFSAPGYATTAETVTVSQGQTVRLNVVLTSSQ